AETETNHSGYNLYRNEAKDLDNAIKINAHLIDQGSEIGTQNNYFYTDFEVYTNIVYYYWLESVSLNGASDFYGPLTVTIGDPTQEPLPPVVPMVTKLYNAFPNPFNPNTNIRYSLKEAGKVNIEIYNMKGQRIKAYHQEHNAPGYYQVSWDGRDENGRVVSSGIYLYRLTTGKYTAAKKMILAK
ncbi:MAG: T9SS type A sorting domain-containing protein, partial [Candidatus Cloacimonetes bacterium]|nr:T9SS type A sorting domain-containing protein [Candidatus Cloacimonadota bacterium]